MNYNNHTGNLLNSSDGYFKNDIVSNEHKSNYVLFIDGGDRDKTVYSNPHKFTVSLGQTGTKISPYIDRAFKNIKYVKLNFVILPRNNLYDIVVSDGFRTYTPTISGTFMAQYRYLLLRIKEITNQKTISTGNNLKNDCFMLVRETYDSDAISDVWRVVQNTRIFNDTDLRNLTKLTVELFDTNGNQIILRSTDGTTIAPISSTDINSPNSSQTNFGNYTNSIEMSLNIELGVCEAELNIPYQYR